MFFYIGDNCPIIALKQVEPNLFLDKGWEEVNGIWYKGYSTDCVLKDAVSEIVKGYQPAGKWCVIKNGKLHHPEIRGFPVYRNNETITNLKLDSFEIDIYPDPQFNPSSSISLEEASELIGNVLLENTNNFYKYNNPEKVIAVSSAGLDTTTTWAVLNHYTPEYTLFCPVLPEIPTSVAEYTWSQREYESDLIDKVDADYWGYALPTYYNEKTWLVTGYYAEVMQYRDAEAINAIANYHGKHIDELATEEDYLYWFLKRPTLDRYKKEMIKFKDETDLKEYLFRTVFYDCQMWHLDNTMFFCPFFDIRIPNIVSGLSIEDLTVNAVTGKIQTNIINRFKPDLLPTLSNYKNEGDTWNNFREHFMNVKLDAQTKLKIRDFDKIWQKSS